MVYIWTVIKEIVLKLRCFNTETLEIKNLLDKTAES